MKDTDFYVPRFKRNRLAVVYGFGTDGHLEPQPWSQLILENHEPYVPSGGAGLFSTAEDYFRFAQMLLNGGQLDGARILSRP